MDRFLVFLVLFLIGSVLALTDATLANFNRGSQVYLRVDSTNYPVKVSVLSCTEHGPVDLRTGFGYWTHCEVEYRDQYLVRTKATLTRSIATADDVGSTLDLWVTCDHLHERCTLGHEPSQLVTFLLTLPRIFTTVFGWSALLLSPIFLIRVFWLGRAKPTKNPLETKPDPPMGDVMSSEEESRIAIRFAHPVGAFLYGATGPQLEIDGEKVKVPGWGDHEFRVSGGDHRVRVWVPYVMPRKVGRATIEVEVPAGGRVELEYMAPTITFAKGALGTPGEQKSAGFRPVMALNVVAVLAIVVTVIVLLTR